MLAIKARGGALLTALFIMTLVAIVATAMSTRLQVDIYRTKLIVMHDKLYLASQAVTFWGLSELNNKQKTFTKLLKQGMVDQYPPKMAAIQNQIKVSGGLYDLQAQFNLNNVLEKKSMTSFINLLHQAVPQINNADATKLAQDVKDWISDYDPGKGKDDATTYYLAQKPPYYPSHQFMLSKSELRLVKNVSASIYLTLETFVTALPESTPININTASKQVLMSLGNGLHGEQVKELMTARADGGIKDLKDISALLKKLDLPEEQITIESQYFLNTAYASSDDFNLVVYSLMKRTHDKDKKLVVSIIGESIGSF
ncbi:MAG: type II secretion system minor pseudopilin GspK [Legionellales bacterium]